MTTPREPDRFEAKAREVYRSLWTNEQSSVPVIAAALRQAADEALERAAQIAAEECGCARAIRALASPAAAPAAEPVCAPCSKSAGMSVTHSGGACYNAPPSEPVAPSLLPRVLAALEDHRGCVACPVLAAELRRYIAEMEGGEDPRALEIHAARMKALDEYEKSARKIGERIDAQKRIAQMEAAIRWALGEGDEFPLRQEQGRYWWRTELRRRAALATRSEGET